MAHKLVARLDVLRIEMGIGLGLEGAKESLVSRLRRVGVLQGCEGGVLLVFVVDKNAMHDTMESNVR
eukprot:6020443-Pleurochrysis_carterae.AAC.1